MTAELRVVLILAHQCTPFERPSSRAGAQRVRRLAEDLPSFGWRAEVMCCPANGQESRLDLASGSSILAVPNGYDPRRGRLMHRVASGNPVLRKAHTAATLALRGDWSRTWAPEVTRRALLRIRNGETGIEAPVVAVVGEHSPDAGMISASRAARRMKLPLVLDFRDPLLYPYRSRAARTTALAAYWRHIRYASATTNVQPEWVRDDERRFRRPSFWVPHSFDQIDPLPAADRESERFRLTMYGGLYHFYDFETLRGGLSQFIDGLPLDDRGRVKLQYWGANVDVFHREFGMLDIDIFAEDVIPRATLLERIMASDAVLIPTLPESSRTGAVRAGVAPSKLIELMPTGVPVVVAPGDGGSLDDFARRTGVARVGASVESTAALLRDVWQSHRGRPAARPLVFEEFSRPRSAERFARVLDFAVEQTS